MNAKQLHHVFVIASFAVAVVIFAANTKVAAQDIFGGQGIRAPGSGSNNIFNSQRAAHLEPKSKNPFSGLFKKPTFLNGPDGPKVELKLPTFDFLNKLKPDASAGVQAGPLFAGLPGLPAIFPKRSPGEPSMLQKMKTKTDSFFDKAFKFQGLFPSQAARGETKWEDVKKTYEQMQSKKQANQRPLNPPVRSAQTPTGQTQRF